MQNNLSTQSFRIRKFSYSKFPTTRGSNPVESGGEMSDGLTSHGGLTEAHFLFRPRYHTDYCIIVLFILNNQSIYTRIEYSGARDTNGANPVNIEI